MAWDKSPLKPYFGLIAVVVTATVISSAGGLGLSALIERKIELPLGFGTRAAFGRATLWHPRLKIVTLDDAAAAVLGDVELNALGWATLLEGLGRTRVESITIDEVFGQPPLGTNAEVSRFLRAVEAGPPVATAAIIEPRAVAWRRAVDFDSQLISAKHYTANGEDPLVAFSDVPIQPSVAYGPFGGLVSRVAALGHLSYDGRGYLDVFSRNAATLAVPHLGLALSRPLESSKGLRIGSLTAPVSADGRLLIDFPDLTSLEIQAQSLAPMLRAARDNAPLPGIQAGDTVLILTRRYSGAPDRDATPLGTVASGTVLAAVMNGAMTGKWLTPWNGGFFLILLAALAGMKLGQLRDFNEATFALSGAVAAIPLIALMAFTWRNVSMAWVLPTYSMATVGAGTMLLRWRALDTKRRQMRAGLEGLIPRHRLRAVLKAAEHIEFPPSERVLTLMFVDVVGFAAVAQSVPPAVAFAAMQDMVTVITKRVHAFDGVVDRTLDDGLLCYFGHAFDPKAGVAHAEQALRCAAALQRENLERMLADSQAGRAVFPLRIGVNTATVFVGDPMDARRVAVSLIGHGVGMGRRLEAACEYNKIMLGAATFALLPDSLRADSGARRKLVRDDSEHEETVEAYEFDPFTAMPERLAAAVGAYRTFARNARVDERLRLTGDLLRASTPYGPARVVDVSRRGIAIVLEPYLAAGLELHLTLEPVDERLGAALGSVGLPPLVGEVRWSRPVPGGHLHGLLVKNLGESQREALYLCLATAARRHPKSSSSEPRKIGRTGGGAA